MFFVLSHWNVWDAFKLEGQTLTVTISHTSFYYAVYKWGSEPV